MASRFSGGYRQPSRADCNHELSPLPAGEGQGEGKLFLIRLSGPPHPQPFSRKGRREQITLNDIFQQNREVSCLPFFCPLISLSLLIGPRTAGSANPVAFHCLVTVSYWYPTRSARFDSALHSLRTLLSSPLFAATFVSPIPPHHCCLFGKSNLLSPSFLPINALGILAPFSRRESLSKELLCHWRYLPSP